MSLFKPQKRKTPLGIYIHVPFCRSKCAYCDFYSLTQPDAKALNGYLDAICDHIRETGPLAPDHLVDTVYFGGGTPTYFGAEGMVTILNTLRKNFDIAADAEITFEANPDSVTPKLLRKLRSEGFNRVSLGVQSDDDRILQFIGRPHTYAEAVKAVQQIRKAGFRNLSLDLIMGLPGQTLQGWEKTLNNVTDLKPEHISCYGLTLEEGTPLYACKDNCGIPDDDRQADMYLSMVEILRQRGYRQYEVSNFCRRGHESKHNLKYWTGGEYLGFGPDASSDFAGKRFRIVRDLRKYIDGIHNGGQVLEEVQEVPPRERAGEYLMLRLRTSLGVSGEEYEKKYLLPFDPIEEALVQCRERGFALRGEGGRWRLTPEGLLLSNDIISDLMKLQEKSEPLAKRR